MQQLVEGRLAGALLSIQSERGCWALPSAAVASVEAFDPEASEDAVELLQLLGAPRNGDAEPRVLVVQAHGERQRLVARGALKLLEAGSVSLLPLPAALQKDSPLVSHVGVVAGVPALFVVSPERLLSALRDAPSSPPAQESVRGSTC